MDKGFTSQTERGGVLYQAIFRVLTRSESGMPDDETWERIEEDVKKHRDSLIELIEAANRPVA